MFNDDVVSRNDLCTEPMAVIKKARKTGRPVLVTNRGKPDVVVMDAATFHRRLRVANLARLLASAEADVAAGRTRPIRDFLTELHRGKKASR